MGVKENRSNAARCGGSALIKRPEGSGGGGVTRTSRLSSQSFLPLFFLVFLAKLADFLCLAERCKLQMQNNASSVGKGLLSNLWHRSFAPVRIKLDYLLLAIASRNFLSRCGWNQKKNELNFPFRKENKAGMRPSSADESRRSSPSIAHAAAPPPLTKNRDSRTIALARFRIC